MSILNPDQLSLISPSKKSTRVIRGMERQHTRPFDPIIRGCTSSSSYMNRLLMDESGVRVVDVIIHVLHVKREISIRKRSTLIHS